MLVVITLLLALPPHHPAWRTPTSSGTERPAPGDRRRDRQDEPAVAHLDHALPAEIEQRRARLRVVRGGGLVSHPLARQAILRVAALDVLGDRRVPRLGRDPALA